jgi:hypothetical protein
MDSQLATTQNDRTATPVPANALPPCHCHSLSHYHCNHCHCHPPVAIPLLKPDHGVGGKARGFKGHRMSAGKKKKKTQVKNTQFFLYKIRVNRLKNSGKINQN